MALSDALVDQQATQPAAPAAETTAVPTADAPQAPTAERVYQGPEVNETIAEGVLGSESGSWELVANLNDGSRDDKFKIKDPKTGQEVEINEGKTIGYAFKALKDGLRYIEFPIAPGFLTKPFQKTGEGVIKTAKKGEVVNLTVMEAMALVALPEINGFISGGKFPVTGVYSFPKASAAGKGPAPMTGHLQAATGSIKAAKHIKVILRLKTEPNPNNPRTPIVVRGIAKGYERFAPAIEQVERKSAAPEASGSVVNSYNTQRNDKAAKFLAGLGVKGL